MKRYAPGPVITVEARIPLAATGMEHSKALVVQYNDAHPEESLHRLESSHYVDHYYSKGSEPASLFALMNPRVSVSVRARNWTGSNAIDVYHVQITQITTNPTLTLPNGIVVPFQTTQRDNLGGALSVKEATAIMRRSGYKPWFTLGGQNHKYHLYGQDVPEVTANFQNVTLHIGNKTYKAKFIDISVEDHVDIAVATLTRTVTMFGAIPVYK